MVLAADPMLSVSRLLCSVMSKMEIDQVLAEIAWSRNT